MIAESRIGRQKVDLSKKKGHRFFENYYAVKEMCSQLEMDGKTNTLTLCYSIDDAYVQKVKDSLPPYILRGFFDNVIIIK